MEIVEETLDTANLFIHSINYLLKRTQILWCNEAPEVASLAIWHLTEHWITTMGLGKSWNLHSLDRDLYDPCLSGGGNLSWSSLIQWFEIIHYIIIHNFRAVRKRQEVRVKNGIMKSNIFSMFAVLLQFDEKATNACEPIFVSQLDFSWEYFTITSDLQLLT